LLDAGGGKLARLQRSLCRRIKGEFRRETTRHEGRNPRYPSNQQNFDNISFLCHLNFSQNKIKLDSGQEVGPLLEQTNQPIPEEDGEEDRLIDGIKRLNGPNGGSRENDRPARKQSLRDRLANSTERNCAPGKDGDGSNDQDDSVFKSANWLSDSELIFSLTNQVGGLVRALRVFQELNIGIKHVESRPSKRRDSEFEIFVDIDCSDKEKMRKLVHHLR
jgi:hypothetical protein